MAPFGGDGVDDTGGLKGMADRRGLRRLAFGTGALASAALVLAGAGVGTAAAAPKAPAVKTASVKIQSFLFKPHTLKITTKTKVTWTNLDSTGHNIQFADFGIKRALGTGQTWSHKFVTPGTYAYHCQIHPDMTGKVVVSG
jgi:plastocyanin